MDPVKKSLITLHLAVVLLGGTGLFSNIIPLSAIDITLGRSLFACLALCLFVRAGREHLRLERRLDYFIAIGLGMLMAAHWATYFASMQYAGVSVGMIAMFTFPVITVLMEPLFEKTRLAWQDMLSALVVVIGIVLIVPEVSLDNDVTLGVGLGITGIHFGFCYLALSLCIVLCEGVGKWRGGGVMWVLLRFLYVYRCFCKGSRF